VLRSKLLRMSDLVIFACVHNAGRSQMAAAFFNRLANPAKATAVSAGTQPADRVHPIVVEAMKEEGLDVAGNRPRRLTDDLARRASLLITMGCGDECPIVPGLMRDDWLLDDPKDRSLADVRLIRNAIRERVSALISNRHWNG